MEINGKKVLICNCEATMPLDRAGLSAALSAIGADLPQDWREANNLCRAQIGNFLREAQGEQPLLVACTQEAPLFDETAVEAFADRAAPLVFANIREKAGWSVDAKNAAAKIAALLAEATLETPSVPAVAMTSEGVALIYGRDERAIEAAEQLASRLDVTVLLTEPKDVIPPRIMNVPVFQGTIAAAKGHLGGFEITVNDYAPPVPSSRGGLAFESGRDGAISKCDLILDLTGGTPLFPHPDKRDGYFFPDPGSPALVARALFDIADTIGEFEKPRYIDYDATICAHGASAKRGCTRCVDLCPAGAVASTGDKVSIDPFVCGGCGLCAAACPTGAAAYTMPGANMLAERLRTLLSAYRDAGGPKSAGPATVLFHDTREGEDAIAMMARFGDGLPANLIPVAVNETTQLGLDAFAPAFAYGAAAVRVLLPPSKADQRDGLADQVGLTAAILAGLGFDGARIGVIELRDPLDALAALSDIDGRSAPAAPEPGRFLPMGGKRTLVVLALRHLHAVAPAPVDVLPLPEGAPFGGVEIDADGCTLCLSCVAACPAGALTDDPERPKLCFNEEACVQCGLCRATCPESVIALAPRLNFGPDARLAVVVKQEHPFHCVRCGKPFGVRSTIHAINAKLLGKHWMFDGAAAERILMCEDCRVVVQFDAGDEPFKSRPRPPTRTTMDDLRQREIEAARAKLPKQRERDGG